MSEAEENLRLREALQAADVICRKYESENERLREALVQHHSVGDAPLVGDTCPICAAHIMSVDAFLDVITGGGS